MGCELKSNRPVHGCYCCSFTALCLTVCHSSWFDCLHQAPPSFIISQRLLKFMSIDLVMLSNHFVLCHPLLIWPSIFPSIRVFSNELAPRISGSVVKNPTAKAGNRGSSPDLEDLTCHGAARPMDHNY